MTSYELLNEFFSSYPEIKYSKGDKILRPNEYYDHIYMVNTGLIRVFKILESGQEITISFYNPNKQKKIVFGYTSLLTNYYVDALTPVILRRAPKTDFQMFVNDNPILKDHVISDLLIYFEEVLKQVEWLSVPDAYTRIKLLLHSLAVKVGFTVDNKIFLDERSDHGLKVTHSLIASLSGLSRETVTMQINRLSAEGYLSRENNIIIIEDIDALIADTE